MSGNKLTIRKIEGEPFGDKKIQTKLHSAENDLKGTLQTRPVSQMNEKFSG